MAYLLRCWQQKGSWGSPGLQTAREWCEAPPAWDDRCNGKHCRLYSPGWAPLCPFCPEDQRWPHWRRHYQHLSVKTKWSIIKGQSRCCSFSPEIPLTYVTVCKLVKFSILTSCVDIKVGGLVSHIAGRLQTWSPCMHFAGVTHNLCYIHCVRALVNVLTSKQHFNLRNKKARQIQDTFK